MNQFESLLEDSVGVFAVKAQPAYDVTIDETIATVWDQRFEKGMTVKGYITDLSSGHIA